MERSKLAWRLLRNAAIGAGGLAAVAFVFTYIGTFLGHAPEGWRIGWAQGWAENWLPGMIGGAAVAALGVIIVKGEAQRDAVIACSVIGGIIGALVVGLLSALFGGIHEAFVVGIAAANAAAPAVLVPGAGLGAAIGLVASPVLPE